MAESADDVLAELEAVRVVLQELAGRPDGVVDEALLHRSERAIAAAIAVLAPSREEGAPAREAEVAGAAPRAELPLARDLLITIDLMRAGLGV